MRILVLILAMAILGSQMAVHADEVVMQNGDKIHGNVLSLTTNILVVQNDNLGTVSLPRTNVASIVFGTATASPPVISAASALQPKASQDASDTSLAAVARSIQEHSNLVDQVETQVLGSSNPDATAKINQMLDDLSSGKMNMNDLRAQAQSAADQLRSAKQDMAPEDRAQVDVYLTILDGFLRESASENTVSNSATP